MDANKSRENRLASCGDNTHIGAMHGELLIRYPLNGWQPAQRFCVTAWPGTGESAPSAFKAAASAGTWVTSGAESAWNFNLQLEAVDPPPRIWSLTNAVAIAAADQPHVLAYQVLVQPHVWAGFAALPCIPSLFAAEGEVQTPNEDCQELSADGWHVVLVCATADNGIRYAWAVSEQDLATARADAEAALDIDVAARAADEWERRLAVLDRQRALTDNDRHLQAAALEKLIGALRSPQGVLAHMWSESTAHPGAFHLNEVLPLVEAWRVIDPAIAAQLIKAALDAQTGDGFLPAWIKPDGTATREQSMWPALATAASKWTGTETAGKIPEQVAAATARGLVKMLDRFEVKGAFRWAQAEEAFVPDLFDDALATVDVAALLLMECEACLRAVEQGAQIDPLDLQAIRTARTALADHLAHTLWNPKTNQFTDRYQAGTFIRRQTLGRVLPLGTTACSPTMRSAVWDAIQGENAGENAELPALWEYWTSDPISPPVSPLHIAYACQAIQAHGEPEQYLPLMDRWHTALKATVEANNADPVAAALALALKQPVDISQTKKYAKWVLWMDQHRAAIWTLTAGPVVAVLLGISLYLLFRSDPTGVDMEAMHGIAERHYRDGHYDRAIAIYQDLHRHAPRNTAINHALANALHRAERYAEAEAHYRLAVENEDWPSPRSLRNLAITLYKQGNYGEAIATFEQLLDLYGEHYPELAAQARTALQIIDEQAR